MKAKSPYVKLIMLKNISKTENSRNRRHFDGRLFFVPICGSRNSIRVKSGAVSVFWSKSVNGGFAIETRTVPAHPSIALEGKHWPWSLFCVPCAQYVCIDGAGRIGRNDLGKGGRNHEGRLLSNSRHLYHRRCRHCGGSTASDEFLKVRPNRPRIQVLAQAHHHHLGGTERAGLHHGVYHALLSGRPVDGVRKYGYFGWNCRMDRGADHVRP